MLRFILQRRIAGRSYLLHLHHTDLPTGLCWQISYHEILFKPKAHSPPTRRQRRQTARGRSWWANREGLLIN